MVSDQSKSSFFQTSSCYRVDDEYIDIELSSSKSLFCFSPQSKDFEFQMCSINNHQETITSSADELFFQGKLLPLLHLPPPLQMVQNRHHLLTTATAAPNNHKTETFQEMYLSPFESCNISLSEIQDDHLFEIATDRNSFIGFCNDPVVKKSSWTKKLKKSLLGQKLAYLKSLFSKSGCTDEHSCVKSSRDCDEIFKNSGCLISNQIKVSKKNSSFGENLMKNVERDIFHSQRRSFSGAILQRHSTNTSSCSSSSGSSSSSSSFSFSSSQSQGFCDLQLLKRSNSANSDIESSIEGAIAYCKKTQQPLLLLKED